jgi:hypothetical protein
VQFLYPWIVLVHVVGAFGFALAHGGSAFAAFRIRREREPQRLAALLDLSEWTRGLLYGSLLVLIAAGVAAGIIGGWFGQAWIWAAIGVLVAVTVGMLAYAAPYYQRVRQALGLPGRGPRPAPPAAPASAADLAALLDSRRPEGIAAIGGLGLAVIIWLMVLKPF